MNPVPQPHAHALNRRGGVHCIRAGILYLCLGATVAIGFPATALAQSTEFEIELRTGLVGSTPLVEDEVVNPAVLAVTLGDTVLGMHTAEPVEVGAAPAPFLALAAIAHLSPVLGVEAAAGWTFAELTASSGGADRGIEPLGVGHALVSVRRRFGERYHARLGVGAVRYYGEDASLFAEGSDTEALFAAGTGALWPVGPVHLGIELIAQLHQFGTVALRRAGGLDGTVYRFGLAGRISYGGGDS